jgi:hypothetical protein
VDGGNRGCAVELGLTTAERVGFLRQAASGIAAEWSDREAARLLLDAATLAEIGA